MPDSTEVGLDQPGVRSGQEWPTLSVQKSQGGGQNGVGRVKAQHRRSGETLAIAHANAWEKWIKRTRSS